MESTLAPTSTNCQISSAVNLDDKIEPIKICDDYWRNITWKEYHKTNKNFNLFVQDLEKKDEMVLSVIHGIFSSIYVSINFSSKRLGFDEIFRCYTDDNNKYKMKDSIKSNDNYTMESNIYSEYVSGIQSFTNYPCGMICYHKSNELLFQLCSISLMLNYRCIPNKFIKEFNNKIIKSDRNCLFNTKRSSGKIQHCIINSNTSIVYKNSKEDDSKWIVFISFDNYDDNLSLSELEIREREILKTKIGTLTKTVELADFLDYNTITKLTFEKSKYVNSLERIFDKTFNNVIDDKIPVFISFDDSKENINERYYNKYFKYIHDNVKKYFLDKLDEYLISVQHSMTSQGINFVVE